MVDEHISNRKIETEAGSLGFFIETIEYVLPRTLRSENRFEAYVSILDSIYFEYISEHIVRGTMRFYVLIYVLNI